MAKRVRRVTRSASAWALAVGILLLGTAAVVLESATMSSGLSPALFALANLIVFVDLLDLAIRLYYRQSETAGPQQRSLPTSVPLDVGTFTPYQMRLHVRPFALLLSVHNPGRQLEDFLAGLGGLRERLWVIDDASTDDTWERLQKSGVHCVRGLENRNKPGAIRTLLDHLPGEIATVVVLDPDARLLDGGADGLSDIERVIFEFQRSRMAALCPRIAVRPDGWLSRFQELEYAVSFDVGRKALADHTVTSGMAIYRRDALCRVMGRHTLSVYAEDLRNALLLISEGERIYYDERLVVETEGKADVRGWFSQRVGWFYGLLMVYVEHAREVLRAAGGRPLFIYHYIIYVGVFTLALHPLKILAMATLTASALNGLDLLLGLGLVPDHAWTRPAYFAGAYLKYSLLAAILLLVAVPRRDRLRLLGVVPFYFFYALANLVAATVGYLNWISVRLGRPRFYRDHFASELHVAAPGTSR